MKRLGWIALGALLASAGAACAQEGSRPPTFRLVSEEIQALHPASAKARGVEGEAQLSCEASGGAVWKCAVLSESPIGEGFGAAALTLAKRYESQPRSGAGWVQPFSFKVRFELPKPETVTTSKASYVAPRRITGPSMDRRYEAWPRAARFSGLAGWANLWCVVTLDGALAGCSVANESRAAPGAGEAALKLVSDFRFEPGRKNGTPVAMSTLVPVNFRCDAHCRAFEAAAGLDLSDRGWVGAPTPLEISAAYPAAARARGVEGYVRLDCAASRDGRLSDCRVVAESRPGEGFGAAALKLTDRFTLAALGRSRISLSIAFDARAGRVQSLWDAGPWPNEPRGDATRVATTVRARCEVGGGGRLQACALYGLDALGAEQAGAVRGRLDRLRASLWTLEGHSTQGSIAEFEFSTGPMLEPVLVAGPIAPPRTFPGVIDYRPLTALPLDVDLARYYPDRAQRMEASGRVVLECARLVDTRPRDCRVASESPPEFGFGDAALRVSEHYRYMPGSVEGVPLPLSASEPLRIPIGFAGP